jgi:hypothetical protein
MAEKVWPQPWRLPRLQQKNLAPRVLLPFPLPMSSLFPRSHPWQFSQPVRLQCGQHSDLISFLY